VFEARLPLPAASPALPDETAIVRVPFAGLDRLTLKA